MNYNILRMSKCKKAKNPCRICLQNVTQKTGLKCQGACDTWVHYACLNYTPGRIKDIKKGIITVNCPCPDCKSTLPKELRSDEPYSCNNMECPANNRAKCDNTACPINAFPPEKMNQTSDFNVPRPGTNANYPTSAIHAPLPTSGLYPPPLTLGMNAPPLKRCGDGCKRDSQPNLNDFPGLHAPCPQPVATPMLPPAMNASPQKRCGDDCKGHSQSNVNDLPALHSQCPQHVAPPAMNAPPHKRCGNECKGQSQSNVNDLPALHSQYPQHVASPAMNAPPPASCEAGCRKQGDENVARAPTVPKVQPRDAKPGILQKQRNSSDSRLCKPSCNSRNFSSTDVHGDYGQSLKERLPYLSTLQQMCDTVGQLTNQINCLMNKMRQVVEEKSGGGCGRGNDKQRCSHAHAKSRCHKPCFCPENPGRRS